jgi:GNAT superfamily N-acetyltransferase
MSELTIRTADLASEMDGQSLVSVLNAYASDPSGGGQVLPADVKARLVPALRGMPNAMVLLAFAGDRAVGIATCFFGLSTFRALPLLNVHDLAVVTAHRGRGIGRALLAEAERQAIARGCCKLTLEVQDGNAPARALYASFGFTDFEVGNLGATRFLSKPLSAG